MSRGTLCVQSLWCDNVGRGDRVGSAVKHRKPLIFRYGDCSHISPASFPTYFMRR